MLYLIKKQKAKTVSELKYSIITEIKKSDKSKVYLVSAEGYDFPVILKEIRHGNIQVFRALKEISCEQIPKIFHVKETKEGLLIVEEYVEGELLTEYLSSGNLTEIQCLDIAEQICAVLDVLHSHKPALIHRDVKPSNIIITSEGKVKLIDFDSTRLYKEESDGDTRLLGTEKYAAPEQYGFSQTDCRSDIYSLGVVFEKFTGFLSVRRQKQWKRIVEKCTLFSPDSRFQTVTEIEHKLKKIRRTGCLDGKKLIIAVSVLVLCIISVVILGISKLRTREGDLPHSQSMVSADIETTTYDMTESIIETTTELNTTLEPGIEITTDEVVDLDVDYSTIPPEWRDLNTDEPVIVSLKEQIREQCAVVLYHFKDRMQERDFLFQIKDLECGTITLKGLKLISEKREWEIDIEEKYYELKDNVIVIDKEYMNSLEDGYYMLGAELSQEDGEIYRLSVYLYVSASDMLKEPEMWLQNTTYDYKGEPNEKIHAVLKNDSQKEIVDIYMEDGSAIDSAMYEVQQDGRVLEISEEFLASLKVGDVVNYYVGCKDGSSLFISISR